jgi:uncharacterized protein (TIGR03437 family)
VIVQIDALPPAILAVTTGTMAVDAARPARPGETLIVTVNGLAEAGAAVAPSRVRVTVAGIEHSALAVAPATAPPAAHQILFTLSGMVPAGQHPLTVSLDGKTSLPGILHVRP